MRGGDCQHSRRCRGCRCRCRRPCCRRLGVCRQHVPLYPVMPAGRSYLPAGGRRSAGALGGGALCHGWATTAGEQLARVVKRAAGEQRAARPQACAPEQPRRPLCRCRRAATVSSIPAQRECEWQQSMHCQGVYCTSTSAHRWAWVAAPVARPGGWQLSPCHVRRRHGGRLEPPHLQALNSAC